MTLYSLKILKEAVVKTKQAKHKLFEESIVLTSSFQENNTIEYQRKVLDEITKKEPAYSNQYGEEVSWRAILIIDVYEVDFPLEIPEDYYEVFSRFIEMSEGSTGEQVVKKFFSDYTWGKLIEKDLENEFD